MNATKPEELGKCGIMQHPEIVTEPCETTSYQDASSQRLLELLDRKRKQLDHEIADFKAKKEKEYKLYEQRLRSENRSLTVGEHAPSGSGVEANTQDERHPLDNGQRPGVAELDETDKESGVKSVGKDMSVGNDTSGSRNGENRRPARIDLVDGPDHIVEGCLSAPRQAIASTPPHDREKEFRGLFTPSYLPLLDGPVKCHTQAQAVKPISPSVSRSNSTPSLSSSATLATMSITPLLPSPGHQRLSASVPRQKPPRRRSSSARSDASLTSLRSSLRDPRQPRSPKRVLFSIDNTVVSPNSSPAARRTVPPILLPPPSGFAVSQELGEEKKYNEYEEDSNAVQETEDAEYESRHPSFAFEQSVNAMTNISSPSRGQRLVEPIITSPMIGEDDFEAIDNDDNPLFAFDEDVELRDSEDGESNQVYPSHLPWRSPTLMSNFRRMRDQNLKTRKKTSCQWPRHTPAVYPLKSNGLHGSRWDVGTATLSECQISVRLSNLLSRDTAELFALGEYYITNDVYFPCQLPLYIMYQNAHPHQAGRARYREYLFTPPHLPFIIVLLTLGDPSAFSSASFSPQRGLFGASEIHTCLANF